VQQSSVQACQGHQDRVYQQGSAYVSALAAVACPQSTLMFHRWCLFGCTVQIRSVAYRYTNTQRQSSVCIQPGSQAMELQHAQHSIDFEHIHSVVGTQTYQPRTAVEQHECDMKLSSV
jgi:hypothetical protein